MKPKKGNLDTFEKCDNEILKLKSFSLYIQRRDYLKLSLKEHIMNDLKMSPTVGGGAF